MSLQDRLKYEEFNPKKESQLFYFEVVNLNNNTLRNSCLIVNNLSNKVLDVPEASHKKGVRIVQWKKNRRWNQRWLLIKVGDKYIIRNVLNGLCLDINGQGRNNGEKVIQWN